MFLSNSLHILCFGDSLTAGHTPHGDTMFHPYGIALKKSLEASLSSWNISTDIQGLPGDQVISPPGHFVPRMNVLYDEVHPHDPYDWAIILGGTNDLNQNRLPDNIFSTLQKVWDVPLSKNTKVLALTISGCGMCSTEVDSRTIDLNQRILNHEAENYYTYDLYEAMPYWEMDKEMRDEVWDDNIHFTAKGYDMIGKLLADQLFEIMQKAEDELYTSYAAKDDLRRRKTEVMAR